MSENYNKTIAENNDFFMKQKHDLDIKILNLIESEEKLRKELHLTIDNCGILKNERNNVENKILSLENEGKIITDELFKERQ